MCATLKTAETQARETAREQAQETYMAKSVTSRIYQENRNVEFRVAPFRFAALSKDTRPPFRRAEFDMIHLSSQTMVIMVSIRYTDCNAKRSEKASFLKGCGGGGD